MPYFSVIITNYNYAKFLPQAINSVLRQSFADFELIVVDDGSADHSRDVILSYGDKIKPVFLERNGGQGAAFNAGVKVSKGKYISFLDADDVFLPDKLRRLHAASLRKPNATMIYNLCCNMNVMGDIRPGIHPQQIWEGNLSEKLYRYGESVSAQTSLLTFSREFIDKIFPICQYFNRQAADASIQYLACLLGEVVCVREPLTLYRLHGGSIYNSLDFHKLESIRKFIRRNEKEYYYINTVLARLGETRRLDIKRYRYHLGNLCIFNMIGKWEFIRGILFNPNFKSWWDKKGYINYVFGKRQEYLRSKT